MSGNPVFRGTRVPVHMLAGLVPSRARAHAHRVPEPPLRRVRYREPPEGVFLGSGTGQKCVSLPAADEVERPPANGRKAEAPLPAVETRHCEHATPISGPHAHGRAFAALPAGCARIADLL